MKDRKSTPEEKQSAMKEKELTPQESMDIITRMIEASRQRVALPDLRLSVIWAALSIVTAAIVLTVSLVCYTPWIHFVWFAIPLIGIPLSLAEAKRAEHGKGAKTAIDKISDGIWTAVGGIAIALSAICLVFNLYGYPKAWLAMFYFAFVIVGFGAAMQGIVLKERSYVLGGLFSVVSGFVVTILNLCGIPLLIVWCLPLYMLCFLLMFIIPAYVLRRKINACKP